MIPYLGDLDWPTESNFEKTWGGEGGFPETRMGTEVWGLTEVSGPSRGTIVWDTKAKEN